MAERDILTDDAEWVQVLEMAFRSGFVPLTCVFAASLSICELGSL